MSGYQGWTNYETWCVKLWIDNEEGSYDYWRERTAEHVATIEPDDDPEHWEQRAALAQELEASFEEWMPEVQGMWADLLRAAFQSVEWREIAATMIDDAKEEISK